MKSVLLLFAVVCLAICSAPTTAAAQAAATIEKLDQNLQSSDQPRSPVSEEQVKAIKDLLETLESQTGRQEFIAELKAIIAAAEAANDQSSNKENEDTGAESGASVTQSVSELLHIDKAADEAIESYESWLSQFGIRDSTVKSYAMAAVVSLALFLTWFLIAVLSRKANRRLDAAASLGYYRKQRFGRYIWIVRMLLYFFATVGFAYLFFLTLNWDVQDYSVIPAASNLFGIVGGIATLFIFGALLYELLYEGLTRISETGNGRLRTIAPLIRNIVIVTMFVFGGLTLLSELGIDVMPLLAGAGVVGIAIGFGAQTMFKDLITGIIVIIEDLFQIGDWIAVGGSEGTVEKITFRKVDLRDVSGTVHTIPFGSFDTVRNYMKDYSYAVLNVEIAYHEDTDAVCEELKKVDENIRDDDTFSSLITDAMEIMGVDSLGDSAVAIKVRVKTVAGEQWGVAREYRRRIKHRFDEVGIEIPFPHQTLYFGQRKNGPAPPAVVSLVNSPDDPPEDRSRDEGGENGRKPLQGAPEMDGEEDAGGKTDTEDKGARKRGGNLSSGQPDGDGD